MDSDAAAALLGVSVDATPVDIERAWRRRSRESHPDRFAGETGDRRARAADEFIRVTRARDVLLARNPGASVDPRPPMEWVAPRPRWRLIALWAALALVGIFVATFGEPLPFTVVDPILRYGLLLFALVAFAATGRPLFMVLIVIAIAATALHAVLFTTFGTLLGMFLLAAPAIALVTLGRTLAERMRRVGRAG